MMRLKKMRKIKQATDQMINKEEQKEEKKENGKKMIRLNFAGIKSREEMYAYLQDRLQIPRSQGDNLDNIYDFLTLANGRLHIIVEGLSRSRNRLGSYMDGVLKTLRDAEAVTEGMTVEIREQMDADKKWLTNPAVTEQSCAYSRPVVVEVGDKPVPASSMEGLMYRAGGMPYVRLRYPNAMDVKLQIGDTFYPFLETEKDVWTVDLPLDPGFYYTTLYVDNCLVLSPYLPIGYGFCRPANYLEIGPVEDFWQMQDVPHGTIRHEYYESTVTGRTETCICYVPPGYDQSQEEYPVLYLQHGFGENERGWIWQGKVNHILDNLLAQKKAVPMLIVMGNGMVMEECEDGGMRLEHTRFPEELVADIIPFIESRYRVKKDRDHRAMAGLSMGSMQTSILVGRHPELFGWAGLFSGFMHNLVGDDPDNSHLETMKQPGFNEQMHLFFRGMGRQDEFWDRFEKDDGFCETYGVACERREYQGGHDWNVWRKCIRDFLQLVFL